MKEQQHTRQMKINRHLFQVQTRFTRLPVPQFESCKMPLLKNFAERAHSKITIQESLPIQKVAFE
jgi:hypothetical protein